MRHKQKFVVEIDYDKQAVAINKENQFCNDIFEDSRSLNLDAKAIVSLSCDLGYEPVEFLREIVDALDRMVEIKEEEAK